MGFRATDLLLNQPLPSQEWEAIFLSLFRGRLIPSEMKSLLLLLSKRGEDTTEVAACVNTLRRLEPPQTVQLPYVLDVCGTGGDGRHSFNISTVSSFVIAAAGGFVAKHGNRAISSKTGSSDLMEALGVRLDASRHLMLESLRECHLGYFYAPLYHPSFACVQPVRRSMGVRTVFNLLGPLVNPIRLSYQMVGVSNLDWLEPVTETLAPFRRRAAVYRSDDGLDELSTTSLNEVWLTEARIIQKFRLNPFTLGFKKAGPKAYEGGDLKENSGIALGILRNREKGPRLDVVLLNSGFGLWLSGIAMSLPEGIERSRWAIRTGRALSVLEALRRFSRRGRSR